MNPRLRLAGGAVAAATLVLTATPAGAGSSQSLHGTFEETMSGADNFGYDIHGSAKMTVGDGTTTVQVSITGLDPAKTYGSHLHNGTCADGGGGHYQDSEGGATTHGNELHLTSAPAAGLSANPGGVAHGGGSTQWEARLTSTTQTNALSIVVHEPGAAAAINRITCADLS